MSWLAFVVLHGGSAVTFGEYLVRVGVYLLAFAGIGVVTVWLFGVVGGLRARLCWEG